MPAARRYHLRKDEVRKLLKSFAPELAEMKRFFAQGGIEVLELTDGKRVFLVRGTPTLLQSDEGMVPLLSAVHLVKMREVVVDMGAVPHVARGADIMAPGVVSADEDIEPGSPIVVVDERHKKPLAVGLAVVSGREMKGPRGKVVKNLHHVGDKIWDLARGQPTSSAKVK